MISVDFVTEQGGMVDIWQGVNVPPRAGETVTLKERDYLVLSLHWPQPAIVSARVKVCGLKEDL